MGRGRFAVNVNLAEVHLEDTAVFLGHEPEAGDIMESRNIAFAGTEVVSGSGKAAVFSTGMRTEFGRIAHLTSGVESGLSPLQKEIVRATRVIAAIATAMGGVFFGVGYFIGRPFWENFIFAVGIIVANVPEGLLPTVTLSLAMGSQRMARRKALIKTLPAVEALGSVTVICTDKTGTLTQNRMEVKEAWTPDSQESGGGRQEAVNALWRIAFLCNNAAYEEGQYRGDPTETSLLKAAREALGEIAAERLYEIPFDSERKRMSTIARLEGRAFLFTKGALESVLPLCTDIVQKGKATALTEPHKREIEEAYHSLMDRGLRVLAFAHRDAATTEFPSPAHPLRGESATEIEKEMTFAGLIGIEDPPRPEVPEALARCREAGIRVIMITGDGSRTALAIAGEIGLVKGNPVVVEGHEFVRMGDRELRKVLLEKEVLFARMTPKHKMRVVSILQEEGERVAVTGDGVNDAPALKKADIGIAMGISGTDVAKEASDMILLDDNFATIVNAIEEGRAVYENIRKFISYIFSSNIPEIIPYLACVILRIPLPLTIMQILAVDLGTDMLPALALGAEKPTEGLMKSPPRDPRERLLNFRLLGRAYLFLGPLEAVAALFGFFSILYAGGWQWGEMLPASNMLYIQATTACLTAIVVMQVANVFACRSFLESVFSIGFFSNRLIFAGIFLEILLQLFIVYHPWGNLIFATTPISLSVWLSFIPFGLMLFAAEELRKVVKRARLRR
ncbi:MAG: cation-transporting P-type ATPase [Nitrospirales bacterium]|nr:cation-transporting P-type ATPase [Nitrospirales bacterium]